MSDVFEGPGWWMAADSKWYPPDRHPDPAYRSRFDDVPSPPPVPTVEPTLVEDGFPTVVPERPSEAPPALRDLADRIPVGESTAEDPLPSTTATPATPEPARAADPPQPFRVGSTPAPEIPERPVFNIATPPSVVAAPSPAVEVLEETPSHPADAHTPMLRDRLIAAVLFFAGITCIVGSFFTWRTTGSLPETGWDLGDGYVTVLAGLLGASTAGPSFVGFRHAVPKFLAIVAAIAALVVIALFASDLVGANGVSTGWGFWATLIGAGGLAGAGMAIRPDVRFS